MKKKYLIVCTLFIIALLCTFCFYKLYLLSKFPLVGKVDIDNVLNDIQELPITNNKDLANTKFHSMNIYIPENLIVNTPDNLNSNHITFSHTSNSSFKIYLMRSISWYKSLDKPYLGLSSEESRTILKKYDITHDLDMIDYYQKRIGEKNNIFTSKSRIVADHLSTRYIYDQFIIRINNKAPSVLTGDINGTFGHVKNNLSIGHIYNNNDDSEVYSIWIDGMKEDQIKILESIYFE